MADKSEPDRKKCWSKEATFSLIEHWELLPVLWDVKSKDYRNRIKKQNAIKSLSTKFNTSENEISRELHNLRTQFHHELQKTVIKHSGEGVEDTYQSNWEFFRALLFIRTKHSDARTVDNLEQKLTQNLTNNDAVNNTSTNILINSDEEFSNVRKKKKKNEKEIKHDDILENAIKIIKKPLDEYQIFGDFVACELRNLQSRDNQELLKRMIQRAILQVTESDDVEISLVKSFSTECPHSASSWRNSRSSSVDSYYSNFNATSPEEVSQTGPYNILELSWQSDTQEYGTGTSENDMSHL